MPYDPATPASNTALSSAEMRAQLQALNFEIQNRATHAEVDGGIGELWLERESSP